MFLGEFCQQEPKFKRKFQPILETVFCECVVLHPPSNGEGLTLIYPNLGGFFSSSFWGGGRGVSNYQHCLKRVRIMLETS